MIGVDGISSFQQKCLMNRNVDVVMADIGKTRDDQSDSNTCGSTLKKNQYSRTHQDTIDSILLSVI